MWTGLILVCTVEACRVMAGPQVETEQDCWVSIQSGAMQIMQQLPGVELRDAQCVQWSESA